MPYGWFIAPYKFRPGVKGPIRYCSMDDYTDQIIGTDQGFWSESEVLGNFAIVKVKATQPTLDAVAADPAIFPIPVNAIDLTLGSLTNTQVDNLQAKIQALGYTLAELRAALGSTRTAIKQKTLRQVLEFIAGRRFGAALVTTTLASDIDAVTTSITVVDSTNFPAAPFMALVELELVNVTATSGATWTVARGAQGTTANAHTAGSRVSTIVLSGPQQVCTAPIVVDSMVV